MTRTKSVKALLVVLMSAALIIAFMPQTAFTSYAATAKKVKSVTRSYPTTSSAYTMKVGQSKTFRVRLNPKNLKSTSKTTFWYTSKSSVGTLAKSKYSTRYKQYKGYYYAYTTVKAVKAGTTTVTAKSKYGPKASWKVTVKAATAVKSVAISNYSTGDVSKIAVGDILKATADPSDASVSYQWYSVDAAGTATAITGATEQTYKVVGNDVLGKSFKVVVTGTGDTSGTAEAVTTAKATATQVTADIVNASDVAVTGALASPVVGEAITAKVAPASLGSVVSYQWYRGTTAITGETKASYTPVVADLGYTLQCKLTVADNSGVYFNVAGTYTTTLTAVAVKTSLASAAAIQFPTEVGKTDPVVGTAYTATLVDPASITTPKANYTGGYICQWYNGTYDAKNPTKNAVGTANSLIYTPVEADLGKTLTLVVTGAGNYSGTIMMTTKAVTAKVATVKVAPTAASIGTAVKATVATTGIANTKFTGTYQWYRGVGTAISAIAGATSASYTPVAADLGEVLTCKATGTGSFSGTAEAATVAVVAGEVGAKITNTNGDVPAAGDTLKVAITPTAAEGSVSYQWYYGNAKASCTTAVAGATAATFTPQSTTATGANYVVAGSFVGCKVTVNTAAATLYTAGTTAEATSNALKLGTKLTAPIVTNVTAAADHVTYNQVGHKLKVTAGALVAGTDYTVKWYRDNCANEIKDTKTDFNGETTGLGNDNNDNYALDADDDVGHTVYAVITAKGDTYTGSMTSNKIAPITGKVTATYTYDRDTVLGTALANNTATYVGDVLKATLGTTGMTATYKWYRVPTTGDATLVSTAASYTLTTADVGYKIKCEVTGTGAYANSTATSYEGTVAVAKVALTATVDSVNANIVAGDTITVTVPKDAEVTYAWVQDGVTIGTGSSLVVTNAMLEAGSAITLTVTPSETGKYMTAQVVTFTNHATYFAK